AQVNSLQESVSTEQGKLSHLQALLPQYDQLTSAVQSAQAAQASAASQAASSGQSAGSLSQNLATEQAKLDHLKSLLPKYDELSTNLQSAQALSNGLSNQMQTMQLAQVLPASSETKLVDPARPDSQAVNSLLGYGLGIVSGLILGLAAVYVAGLVRPRPITPEELAEVLEAPLLVRLPARVRRG
ncbi:MAG: hypothetical protein J2P28_13925, partial [Actinobacteria bacterium]|nr:hypothetical protein [Actinomycetota bacterium]